MSYYLLDNQNPNAKVRSNGKRGWYYTTRTQPIRGIVVHTPQALNIDGPDDYTAEAVAKFFARVDRPASAHVNIDSDSTVELLPDDHTAFHAAGVNSATLGAEVGWRHDMWLDDPALTTLVLERFAVWAAPRCVAYDIPPIRRTEKTKWENGGRGFLTHAATEAWRGYPGRRRDPGVDFPWTQFFTLLKAEIARLDGDTMGLEPRETEAIKRLTDLGIFTKWTTDEEVELHTFVPLATLAVFLDRLYKRLEQTTLPAPAGIQSGDAITISGDTITITVPNYIFSGIIEETP